MKKLVINSIKDAFTGKLWKWLLGSAGSLYAILLLGKDFFNKSIEVSFYIGISFLICLFLIRLVLFFAINVAKVLHRNYIESIYGEAILLLRDSFSKVHLLRRSRKIDDENFSETMIVLCNNLKSVFEKKTKSKCSVSIKVPTKGSIDEQSSVQNLCRDSVATKTRDTEVYKGVNHSIIGNTPYHKIVNSILKGNKDKLHYVNNDIGSSDDYENTSREAYANGILPYSSEIVYPILPFECEEQNNNYECIGFICVDCERKNSFDEKYDVGIVAGVADGIYDIITYRNHQKIKNDGKV